MSSLPARVALLGVEGDARAQLRQVLLDHGAQISIEADPRAVALAELSAADSSIIVVSLDDSIEDALDAFRSVFEDPGVSVIFDEAAVTRKLGGWELARWARHLASKLTGDAAAALPAAPENAQRLPSFDMRPQPGAPMQPEQEMSAATLSDYTSDTTAMARAVPSLEVPGGGARMAYAPAYERGQEALPDDSLQLDSDEIERALAGDEGSQADVERPTAAAADSAVPEGSDDTDFSLYLEAQVNDVELAAGSPEPALAVLQADDNESPVAALDDSYLEVDFAFDMDASATGESSEPALGFAQFGESGDEEMALDPELLALAAELDANTADDENGADAEGIAEFDFSRRDFNDEGGAAAARFEDRDTPGSAITSPEMATSETAQDGKASLFSNLELVSDDDSSANEPAARRHDAVVPQDIDFDALIAGLSLADDDASTVATQQGAVVIFSGAGGPDAVRQVLAHLPDDLPVPVVLMQHLEGANHDRLIPQLAKVSALPVVLAEVGKSVDGGRVFVVPGNLGLSMGRHGNLAFNAEVQSAEAQLTQLAALGRDLVVALASGAPGSLANALSACVAAGASVIAQDPGSCFDAAGCAAAQAAGGRVGAMGELTAKAVERWKK